MREGFLEEGWGGAGWVGSREEGCCVPGERLMRTVPNLLLQTEECVIGGSPKGGPWHPRNKDTPVPRSTTPSTEALTTARGRANLIFRGHHTLQEMRGPCLQVPGLAQSSPNSPGLLERKEGQRSFPSEQGCDFPSRPAVRPEAMKRRAASPQASCVGCASTHHTRLRPANSLSPWLLLDTLAVTTQMLPPVPLAYCRFKTSYTSPKLMTCFLLTPFYTEPLPPQSDFAIHLWEQKSPQTETTVVVANYVASSSDEAVFSFNLRLCSQLYAT